MPTQWSADLYDYDLEKITHPDIKALDLEEGERFECKCCSNPKVADGKFSC